MLVPLKWLKEFVEFDTPARELADRLTMFGLEVEGVIERCTGLDKVIVVKVLGVEPHPDADKLRLARVDTGSEELTIVCGAPNLYEGMKSPLAMVGARLGEDFKVKKAKIRGVESKGMLCSERELGFSDDHSGIMDLDADAPIGQSIIDYFNLETQVLEIGITPNRGDALSILGVARDVAAMLGVAHKDPEIKLEATGKDINQQAGITVSDPDLCKRYAARMVNGITIKPSPVWMKDRLMAAGQRPINNIVDVTNYVMLERGQPLHAFDFDGVAGGRIDVRRANEVEKFTTLDNQERKLKKDMLMIWDAEKPVGLAGVMGGLNSEVEDHTKHVLIEAAFFDPISIRRTAKALGLNSEASYRFERTVDLDGCMKAAERAAELMAQLSGAEIAKGSIDIYPEPYVPYELPLSVKYVNEYLGLELSNQQVVDSLTCLGLGVTTEGEDRLSVKIPAFRPDLERTVDLTEEVARVYGFDNVPASLPDAPILAQPRQWQQKVRARVRDIMAAQGYDEAINFSFIHPRDVGRMRFADDDMRRKSPVMLNPLSEDQSVLRTSLLPGLLATVRRNLGFKQAQVALFEVGKVFIDKGEKRPYEPTRVSGVLCGLAEPVSWWAGERQAGFAQISGAMDYLCQSLGFAAPVYHSDGEAPAYFEPGIWARAEIGGKLVAELGLLKAEVADAFDVDRPVYCFDMDFDSLADLVPKGKRFKHLPRYPEVVRDAAIIVDSKVNAGHMLGAVKDLAKGEIKKWLVNVELFDLYRGKPLDKGTKSLGFRFTYRDAERTLTEGEVMPLHDELIQGLMQKFAGSLRS